MDKPEFAERQAEILVIIHFIDGSERWIYKKSRQSVLKKREKFRTLAAVSGIEFRANQKNKNV